LVLQEDVVVVHKQLTVAEGLKFCSKNTLSY